MKTLHRFATLLALCFFANISLATAATISSVTGPSNGSYKAGTVFSFTVNYDVAVTVDTTGGTPSLSLTIGSTARNATYASGSGGTALIFNYTVQTGETDSDGIASASPLVLNSGTIQDGSMVDATLTFTPPSTSGVFVDTTPPAIGTPDLMAASDSGVSSSDNLTNKKTPNFMGTAEAGSTVTLYDTDGTTVLGTTTANGMGKWTITSSTLSEGAHMVSARATDAAGNVSSASSKLTVTIDTTAPTTSPDAPTLDPTTDSGVSNSDRVTNFPGPCFNGTGADANSWVNVYADGTLLGTTLSDGSGNFTYSATFLADGAHVITAKNVDNAGNIGPASAALSITIDTTPPTSSIGAPSVSTTAIGPVTYNVTYADETAMDTSMLLPVNLTLNKTGTANGTVTVGNITSTGCTVTIGSITGTGTLSITIPGSVLPDVAGSYGSALDGTAFTVLNHAPTDITLAGGRVQDAAAVNTTVGFLSATDADVGDTATFTLVTGTGSTDNGKFSITGSTLKVVTTPALADSTYAIRVRVTDASGATFEKQFTLLVMAVLVNAGDYLVADRGPYRGTGHILVVSKSGSVQSVISTQLRDPFDISVNSAGDFVVADYDYDPTGFGSRGSSVFKIQRQTGAITRLLFGSPLVTPLGVKVESGGTLLVADADYGYNANNALTVNAGAVIRANADGSSPTVLASGGNFFFLQGLALAPNGDIYVANYANGNANFPTCIVKVDKTTGAQTVITTGGLTHPVGLAVESDGNSLVVVDAAAKKLIRVALPAGTQTVVSTDSQFIQPTHVAIDSDGSYIVVDGKTSGTAGQRRLYRVNKSTGVATILVSDGFFEQPRGVTLAQ